MEPVGLAVGVLGLAGLFSSCLEAVDKIQDYKSFAEDSQTLNAQLKAERLRFELWGQQVGFDQGRLSANHHQQLNNPRICSAVKDLFLLIKRVCESDDATQRFPPVNAGSGMQGPSFTIRAQPSRSVPSESNRHRFAWALRGKRERTEEVTQFGSIVQLLHNLVPPESAKGTNAVHGLNNKDRDASVPLQGHFPDQGALPVELRQLIATWEGELRGKSTKHHVYLASELMGEAETGRKIHSWLLGSYALNERYEDSAERRLDGICDWLLNRPAFLNWLSPDVPGTSAELLWIHGPAGFGKTILCARLVDYLASALQTPVLHFFFSSDVEREDPFVVIRSWVSQIVTHHEGAFDLVRQRWEAEQHQVATRATIVSVFRALLQAVPGCTLVVDGLDECTPQTNSLSVTSFLKTMKEAVTDTSARVMIVSRNETTIRQSLLGDVAWRATEYKISPEDVRADTASYSTSIVRRRLSNKTEEVQRDISERMTERCSGQFLVLRMQEDCLDGGLNKKQLRRVIDEEPRGLERLYQRNWERITGSRERERCRAMSLLRWAAFSLRPLTVGEITEAVLIDEGCDDFPIDELPDAIDDVFIDRQILGLCMSLLEIRDAAKARLRTVHLTHFSVKEFLLQVMPSCGKHLLANETLQASNDARENHLLAKMSLLYLSYHRVWRQSTTEREDNFSMSFRDYAADSWHRHLKSGVPGNADLISLTVKFFSDTNPNWNAWREWFDTNERGGTGSITEAVPPNPLYYASKLNLVDIATCLIRQNPSLAAQKSSLGRTALATACSKGHTAIVELLLDAGADETGRDTEGRTSLHSASQNGHVEIVKLLLGKGADVAAASKDGWTSLDSASENGHVEVVKLLLGKGASVAAANKDGWTSLHLASQNGHIEVVKLLLGKGASVAAANKDGWTSLHSASRKGHVEVVQLLLNKGADIAAASKEGWTSLHSASRKGHVELIRFLLEHKGVLPSAQDNHGRTALFLAARNGHHEAVKMLLVTGRVDLAAADYYGSTPLSTATRNGHDKAVEALLPTQHPCLTSKDTFGRTLMAWARRSGSARVMKILFDNAPMADLQIGKEDSVKCGPVTFDPDGAWCDACTLTLLAGSAYYQCEICDGGNFHICLECFEVGITCRDDSHMLMLKGDKHGV